MKCILAVRPLLPIVHIDVTYVLKSSQDFPYHNLHLPSNQSKPGDGIVLCPDSLVRMCKEGPVF